MAGVPNSHPCSDRVVVENVAIDDWSIERQEFNPQSRIGIELFRKFREHPGDATVSLEREDLLVKGHPHRASLGGLHARAPHSPVCEADGS